MPLPFLTVGILGGGQLGRMLALAGMPLGMRFRFFDPGPAEAVQGLGEHVRAAWTDREALTEFCAGLDLATYEFENVPVETAKCVAACVDLQPGPRALEAAQDRRAEKGLFERLGMETAPWRPVLDRDGLDAAIATVGLPAVLKTCRDGYDGKGQRVLRSSADVERAWEVLGDRPLLLEGFVSFRRELSTIAVRDRSGRCGFYPVTENRHAAGILRESRAPAPDLDPDLTRTMERHTRDLMDDLEYCGVLAVEWFEVDGSVVANEFAPRVHNSGHWTQDGAPVCQFENHIRAVAGLPLGDAVARGRTRMKNLIGTIPPLVDLLSESGSHLHLYGKSARAGRKLGHVNRLEPTPEEKR